MLIFWLFARNVDWTQVGTVLRQANASYLIAAVLIICLGYLLRAKRWQVLLEPITPTSLKELFATTTVGFTAIFLIGRAGEIVRPMWLPMRDRRVRPSAALVTLGVERIFDLAALIVFFSVNLLWIDAPPGRETEFEYVKTAGILMLAATALGFIALYVYQRYSEKILAKLENAGFLQNKIGRIVLSILKQLTASLKILRDWREIMSVVFWTLMLWLAVAVPTWLIILAFDLDMDFSHSLFIMGWAAVSSVVPTPGGAAGAFHAATASSLMFLGVDKDRAMAVSIAMHLVYFAPAIIFGTYYFFHGDISIERFKSLLSAENAEREIETDSPDFEETSASQTPAEKYSQPKTI